MEENLPPWTESALKRSGEMGLISLQKAWVFGILGIMTACMNSS